MNMMKLLEQERDRQRRLDHAVGVVRELPADERRAVLAKLFNMEDQDENYPDVGSSPAEDKETVLKALQQAPTGMDFRGLCFVIHIPSERVARAVNSLAFEGSVILRRGCWHAAQPGAQSAPPGPPRARIDSASGQTLTERLVQWIGSQATARDQGISPTDAAVALDAPYQQVYDRLKLLRDQGRMHNANRRWYPTKTLVATEGSK